MNDIVRVQHDQIRVQHDQIRVQHDQVRVQSEHTLRSGGGVKWGAVPAGVTPSWVADMDFGIPEVVREAMERVIRDGQLGYPFMPDGDPLAPAFEGRMRDRYGWAPAPDRVRVFTDLIQVLQVVIEHTTRPGDAVAIHVPTYPPFVATIQRSGRVLVPLGVEDGPDGWELESDGLEERLRAAGCRLIVVVNPHNPTGRVLRRPELERLAEVARALDIPVLSDEIHADLTYEPHTHIPFASLDDDAANRTITATSATKAFNIAGLRCAVTHIGYEPLRRALTAAPLDYFGQPSTLGRVATVAAWRDGDAWLENVRAVLADNRARVAVWASGYPELVHHAPEATYLSWIGFGQTAIADRPVEAVLERGRVLLSNGAEFAAGTSVDTGAFGRINFATSPARLERILEGVHRALS
ncbi:MalY/PatB family protein [Curtobacterium sp. ISL-83]|uniref:MalY/PatB family protein n=1 Tax=Curtobacterium sp. ISL-83 TaxID=2819145 RepID=UPI001BE84FEC|nr:aminotransferase class I/II-fold pyridoxal phosphate-dependent enzyme [Curtobacterium sp. ISL-83]MBT2502406.1 aminotransferase class I/II-fold pyridoxal phosphate-dependent enzyme [Curtobacterium sp. ISL-83]